MCYVWILPILAGVGFGVYLLIADPEWALGMDDNWPSERDNEDP
jgi:hypothetical protein